MKISRHSVRTRGGRSFSGRSSQKGLTIISALLALVIGSTVTYGQIQGQLTKNNFVDGKIEGDLFNRIKDAQNTYALENYIALQNDQPVTKNGKTLDFGSNSGQSMSPGVPDLIEMGYLIAGTSALSSKIDGGIYRVIFDKIPVGCLPAACNIKGDSYIDKPFTRSGSNELQMTSIGAFMETVGGDAALASPGFSTQLVSANQQSPSPNPVAGQPAGIVGARVGYGSSAFGRFLVVGDSRNPNFVGRMTVNGPINSATGSIFTGSGVGGCPLGEITPNGTYVSRSGNCTERAVVSGNDGTVVVKDATGAIRAALDGGTGNIISFDAAGVPKGGVKLNIATGEKEIYADAARNNAGTAGFTSAGTVNGLLGKFTAATADTATFKNQTLTALATIGSACPTEGGMSFAADANGHYNLLRCTSGVFSSTGGLTISSIGSGCSPEGSLGRTAAGESITCSGGNYARLSDRMGRAILTSAQVAVNGSNISKPACLSGSSGAAIFLAVGNEMQKNAQYVNRFATDNGSYWTISITDGSNQPVEGDVISTIYCMYY